MVYDNIVVNHYKDRHGFLSNMVYTYKIYRVNFHVPQTEYFNSLTPYLHKSPLLLLFKTVSVIT